MKWNATNIVDFLKIYEQYPVLWNVKHKEYCNIKLKDEFFKQLYADLAAKGLVEGMDEKQLKVKIKTIKDVYRQELSKIAKSEKSGAGAEEVYSPKLLWFNSANFFREVICTRKIQSNLDSAHVREEEESHEELCIARGGSEKSPSKSPKKLRLSTSTTKLKKRSNEATSEITAAIQQLDKIATNVVEDRPYENFGKYVAAELRQLPSRKAILLQQEIQNSITNAKLSCLDSVNDPHTEECRDNVISPSTDTNDTHSTSLNDYDMLNQAMINTFGTNM